MKKTGKILLLQEQKVMFGLEDWLFFHLIDKYRSVKLRLYYQKKKKKTKHLHSCNRDA